MAMNVKNEKNGENFKNAERAAVFVFVFAAATMMMCGTGTGTGTGWLRQLLVALPGLSLSLPVAHCLKPTRQAMTADRRFQLSPIGRVESPYVDKLFTPKQATIIKRPEDGLREGVIQVFPGYEQCLESLGSFDYIWVISWMHLNVGYKPIVQTRPIVGSKKQPKSIGLFASRAPHRPNQIALSALRVIDVNVTSGRVRVKGLDLLDHTPVLDIKPYVPAFDAFPEAKAGWLDEINPDPLASRVSGYQSFNLHPKVIRAKEMEMEMEMEMELGDVNVMPVDPN